MKKVYVNPTIETKPFVAVYSICNVSPIGGGNMGGGGSSMFNPAPRRKVGSNIELD